MVQSLGHLIFFAVQSRAQSLGHLVFVAVKSKA